MKPKCAAVRVEKYKGKYERRRPCGAHAADGPYCVEHTPQCPVCDSPAYPTGQYVGTKWMTLFKKPPRLKGKMAVVCAKHGHRSAIPIPLELQPKKLKGQDTLTKGVQVTLSDFEQGVVDGVGEGKGYKTIARELGKSVAAVQKAGQRVQAKARLEHLKTRDALVRVASWAYLSP